MAQMFVNGEYVDSISGAVTEIYNPANGEILFNASCAIRENEKVKLGI